MQVSNKKTVAIDLQRTTKIPALEFYKDDTNEIVFELSNDNSYVNLSDLSAVMSNIQRSDGEVISKKLKVSGNKAFYKMNAEEMAVTGEGTLNLQLFKEDKRMTVITMKVNIIETFGVKPDAVTNGGNEQMSDVAITEYLKIADAERIYRKVDDKITEADLADEVKSKLGTGGGTATVPAQEQETKRAIKQNEVFHGTGTKDVYTVNEAGTITSNKDFTFADNDVTSVLLPAGEKEMIFKADKAQQWIAVGADDAMNQLAFFGIGNIKNIALVFTNPYALATKAGYTQEELDASHTYAPGNVYKVVNGDNEISLFYEADGVFKPWYKILKGNITVTNSNKQSFTMNWLKPRLGAVAGISDADKTNRNILTEVKLIERTTTGGSTTTVNMDNYATKDYVNQAVSNNGGSAQKKYAIVVVAGQSNAVGFDESVIDPVFKYGQHDRVKQLGLYEPNNLQIIPLDYCAENFQNMKTDALSNPANGTLKGTKGIHLPLGKLLVEKIPSDYELVIIPMAHGATGFTSGADGVYDAASKAPKPLGAYKWGVNSPYYLAMKARVEHVLSLNPANIYLGTVWIQGENDAAKAAEHGPLFNAMTEDFFNYFNTGAGKQYKNRVKSGTWGKEQWFNVETTNYWYTTPQYQAGINAIWQYYKTWHLPTYVELTAEAKNKTNTDPSKTAPSAPTSHFGQDAYADFIAPAVVAKMESIGAI